MACIRADRDELVILACSEKLTVDTIDGEASWTCAWSELPLCQDLFCGGIDAGDFTEGGKSHEDTAFAIYYRRPWTPAEGNGCDDLVGYGIYDGRTLPTGVEDEDGLSDGIEDDGIRDPASGDRGDKFEGSAVKDADEAGASVRDVGDVAILSGVIESNVPRVGETLNVTGDFASLGIDDHDMTGARDVELMG